MANKFETEMGNLQGERGGSGSTAESCGQDKLSVLQDQIDRAKYARQGAVSCSREGHGLKVHVRGQAVAFWRVEGSDLTLYRAGSGAAETRASDSGQAAMFTARLVAAVWEA